MDKRPVASSSVRAIGYDTPTQTLEVEFWSGRMYQYYNVPDNMYEQFMQAPSKGRFLNYYIKYQYPYLQVA